MTQQDRTTGTGTEGAAGAFDSALKALSMNALNAAAVYAARLAA